MGLQVVHIVNSVTIYRTKNRLYFERALQLSGGRHMAREAKSKCVALRTGIYYTIWVICAIDHL